jgi:hypothetical protein
MKIRPWKLLGTALLLTLPLAVQAADERPPQAPGHRYSRPPVDIYLDLTEEFNRAMQSGSGNRTLSTTLSEDYLHQIAIATRYTVETNLQILKQQERIIQLLEKNAGKTP